MVQGQKVQKFSASVLGFAGGHILSAIFSCLLIESQFLSCELMVNTYVAKFQLSHNYLTLENNWFHIGQLKQSIKLVLQTTLGCFH